MKFPECQGPRRALWIVVVGLVAMSGCALMSGELNQGEPLTDPGVVFSVLFDGPRPFENDRVIAEVSGDLKPDRAAVVESFCYGILLYEGHLRALTGTPVIGRSERLTRVAEMIDQNEVSVELAELVERALLEQGYVSYGDDFRSAGFSEDDLDHYLELREQAPSAESQEIYLTFATDLTTERQRMILARRGELPIDDMQDSSWLNVPGGVYEVVDGKVERHDMDGKICLSEK